MIIGDLEKVISIKGSDVQNGDSERERVRKDDLDDGNDEDLWKRKKY